METKTLPPNRHKSWQKRTVIVACSAIVFILIVILYIRLENVTRKESRRRYEPELRIPDRLADQKRIPKPARVPVLSGTCGGLLEGTNGNLDFVNEPKQHEADTSSSSCLWIIQLINKNNILFTLNDLGQDAHLNLCSGDQLASCSTSNYTKRLNSTQVGSSFEFLGKTLIVVLPSSSASVAFSWNFLTNFETNKTAVVSDGLENLPKEIKNLTASQGIAEGIIAGTAKGVIIIPLDSLKQQKIGNTFTTGVAFNWQSRKVYWIEDEVGMKIANLDGNSVELVIADTSRGRLCGLAVDQVTWIFYYGIRWSNPRIQVCDSMGKKCATVVSGINSIGSSIADIDLFPYEGFMFWSSPTDKKSVCRANIYGTNSFMMILENIYGLFIHKFEEKLYWANYGAQSIGRHGYSRNVLLNTTMYPGDIAVDGDTLYFGGHNPNGVYSVTGNRTVSTIANTDGHVFHVALYGRNKVSSRQNPCKNSPCANLCVLNRVSYSCL